jgi:hypothetical protein
VRNRTECATVVARHARCGLLVHFTNQNLTKQKTHKHATSLDDVCLVWVGTALVLSLVGAFMWALFRRTDVADTASQQSEEHEHDWLAGCPAGQS